MTRKKAKSSTSAKSAKDSRKSNSAEKWRAVKWFVETAMPHELGVACVDLDGVLLSHRSEWGVSRLGRALPLGRQLAQLLRFRGYKIIILTSRPREQRQGIKAKLWRSDIPYDDVTSTKPPADAYFDDKAWRIPKNWHEEPLAAGHGE